MKHLVIAGKKIGEREPPFVIAEGGVNHNGQKRIALKLIDAAADAGADAIKFQTWKTAELITRAGKMAGYQATNLGYEKSQFEMLNALQLKEEWYPELIARAKEKKIILLSAPHGGPAAVEVMEKYHFPAFKIPSGDITNLPLLTYAAKKGKPMLISTGMSLLAEVKEAVQTVRKTGNKQILVFQCTTDYPLAPEDANLRVISTLRKELGVLVGYSDHTQGDTAAIAAVTLGAVMIEKHLTLDKTMEGPDHIASMEPAAFKEMVRKVKQIPALLGNGKKRPVAKELQYLSVARKSIVTARVIKRGERFSRENLAIKRPGDGLPPKRLSDIIGRTAHEDLPADALLTTRMVG